MKKNIFRIVIIGLFSMTLMSCVVKNVCPTKKDANGNEYLDRNACTSTPYLVGLIPMA
ncbi:hypothetical protein IBE97_05915 [Francisella tularensis]|uniref:Lipoprotein n=2 Tax=Francisella tularensis TaxID=263 RepID=A0AAI8BHU5_FRATH|nr:hypothetical protein [Francisella tularensis]ABI82432.1 hypothetical protein FTH_0444 [Francisella tularensis subsp. holarctica OSU18]ADA78076.1 hypothetical protein NE061598_02140 [Francisella tularensis subsp. tularensis NE061598]AFB78548.1 hypothetical protein FTU_0436 [Francisella tularensis subsp. tularensis TIGB03]AFB80093.1 hypothetical protein FTV_0352 [Francisella tularensis subsp. tularensis TI0902]AFX70155.1 hypothetical protein F92_02440 [Francisella tularensis subsp. holarctica